MKSYASLLFSILFVLSTPLVGCGGEQSLEQHLANAKSELAQQNPKNAVIELKNVLKLNPQHLEARSLLGQTYLALGDGLSAQKELTRARDLGTTDPANGLNLAKAMLLQRDFASLLELAMPADMDPPLQAQWLAIRGDAHLAFGQRFEAQALYTEALEADESSKTAMVGMARMAAEHKEARDWIARALAVDENYQEAWQLLGTIEHLDGNLEAAEEAYTKAVQSSGFNQLALLNRGLLRIELKKYEQAGEDLGKLKKQAKNNVLVEYAQGMLLFRQGKYAEAQAPFEAAIRENRRFLPALLSGGANHLQLGHYEQAENYLMQYLAVRPDDASAQQMLAMVKLEGEDFSRVEKLARSALENNPEDVLSLELLAISLKRQDQSEESIDYFRKALTFAPDSDVTRSRLGIALFQQGDQQEGIDELSTALQNDPQLQFAADPLVLLLLQKNEPDRALEVALEFLEDNPDTAEAHVLTGMVYYVRLELGESSAAFTKALDIDPENASAFAGLASLALEEKNPDKAIALYKDALKGNAGHAGLLMSLARVQAGQGNVDGMRSALEEAVEQNPNLFKPRILLAGHYLNSGEIDKAMVHVGKLQSAYPDNEIALVLLAETQLAAGQFDSARATLRDLGRIIPNEPYIHFLMARMHYGLDDRKSMRKELERTILLAPKDIQTRLALAQLLIQENQMAQAEEQLQTVSNLGARESADILSLRGQVAASKGDKAGARAYFQKAFDQSATSKHLIFLTKAKWSDGDRDSVFTDLETWLKDHPDDVETRALLGNFYLAKQRNEDAANAFAVVVEQSPNDVNALNNLAWLLREDDPEKALTLAERAGEAQPRNADILDTLAVVLLLNEKLPRAEQTINRAIALQPDRATLKYHRAMIFGEAGRSDEAIREIKAILLVGTKFPERGDAEALLSLLESR